MHCVRTREPLNDYYEGLCPVSIKKKNTINLEMFASVQLVFYYKMVFTYH